MKCLTMLVQPENDKALIFIYVLQHNVFFLQKEMSHVEIIKSCFTADQPVFHSLSTRLTLYYKYWEHATPVTFLIQPQSGL